VRAGRIRVTREVQDREVTLCDLTAGQTFGELSIIEDGVASATLRAVTDTEVLSVSMNDLAAFLREKPGAAAKFWREIAPGKPFFEFSHGWGLGVLGVGKNLPQPFVDFLATAKESPEQVRGYFFAIGHRIEMYRIAKMMINGHAQVHQLLERWLSERGHGLKGLPDPLGQAGPFLNQITGELRQVLEMTRK
jgi:hypothetical protein